jgi:DNA-binding NarL/FixJ family response regulator
MYDPVFQILFLGENPSWLRVSNALAEAPEAPLLVHRSHSPTELFHLLAAGRWDALAIDLHAWSFEGLRIVQKIRDEFPAIPVFALFYPSVKDLDKKAQHAGATHCLSLNQLTADVLHTALLAVHSENKTQAHLRKGSPLDLAPEDPRRDEPLPAHRLNAISHALNNLLCVISANADVLADRLDGSHPAVHCVDEIKKAAKSAADLMRHIE